MKPAPMPAGAEDLAARLVMWVRGYERNCRCPKCHGHAAAGRSGPLACVDCDFCLANLRKLMLDALTASGQLVASAFSSCVAGTDRANLLSMKIKKGTTRKTVKAVTRVKPKAKAKLRAKAKIKAAALKKPARSTIGLVHPKSGDSDRGLYVRFETPEVKNKVKAVTDKVAPSMNAYIVKATLYCMEKGIELFPAKKETAATG